MMAKTTKKPMRKATSKLPAALNAMENMVIATAALDVHLKQVTERLNAAGISADLRSIVLVGRFSDGSGWVQVNISSGGFASTWPEWAFGVAEGRCTSIRIRRCSSFTIISRSATTCSRRSARTLQLEPK
jgi:hypothetical protein